MLTLASSFIHKKEWKIRRREKRKSRRVRVRGEFEEYFRPSIHDNYKGNNKRERKKEKENKRKEKEIQEIERN